MASSKRLCSEMDLTIKDGPEERFNFVSLELESLPVSVKHEILEIGDSIDLLKTCRFLSKSWNEICCRILRKVSAVPLNEHWNGGEDLENYKNVILDRHDNFPSDWPNPFKTFSILEASCSNASLVSFLERPTVTITTLFVVHNEEFNPTNFEKLLDRHKDSIIHLKIQGNCESTPFVTLGKGFGSGWRALKSISLVDSCKGLEKPCSHLGFITEITETNSIKRLELAGSLRNVTRTFAGKTNRWDQLRYLELRDNYPPVNATAEEINAYMKWTQEIKFPSLTGFKVWFPVDLKPELTSEQLTPYILPFIQEKSAGLEELRVNFMSLSLLPRCPKLRDLSCALMDGDRIQDFDELRFPSLTSIFATMCWKEVPLYTDPKDVPTHRKLAFFKVYWEAESHWEGFSNKEAREILWPSLEHHFPGLKKLAVFSEMNSNGLNAIRKRLPGLEGLALWEINSVDLLGSRCGPAATAKGWPGEDIGNSALVDMAELTHLTLRNWRGSEHSREIIPGCLGRLPKIKFLSFEWNNVMEASDIPKHLGHIQDVTILYQGIEQKRKLVEVAKTMKNLKLKRR